VTDSSSAPLRDDPAAAAVTLVVSTIGRPDALRSLLESVESGSRRHAVEVVVVDQSDDRGCLDVVDGWAGSVPVRGTTSGRGATVGRNAGAQLAVGRVIAFPDDNAWYATDTLDRAVDALDRQPDLAAVSGVQHTPDGRPSMLRWAAEPTTVSGTNLHRTVIESSLFLRRTTFEEIGGFDESIGVGSAGPYQSGEAADLVMRVLETGRAIWYDPSLVVFQDDPRDDIDERFVTKMAGYGAGFGYVHRAHRLPAWLFAVFMARKGAAVVVRGVRGQRVLARADATFLRSAVRGYRDAASAG